MKINLPLAFPNKSIFTASTTYYFTQKQHHREWMFKRYEEKEKFIRYLNNIIGNNECMYNMFV